MGKGRVFANGTPRISSSRERKLWRDGWSDGWRDGQKRGRQNERKRILAILNRFDFVHARAALINIDAQRKSGGQ
jgi:hypothetical protein